MGKGGEVNKPEKKICKVCNGKGQWYRKSADCMIICKNCTHDDLIRNQVIEEYGKYHEYIIKELKEDIKLLELYLENTRNDLQSIKKRLPSEEEIYIFLIDEIHLDKPIRVSGAIVNGKSDAKEIVRDIAKEFAKRIGVK